jgi:hypothetical protein
MLERLRTLSAVSSGPAARWSLTGTSPLMKECRLDRLSVDDAVIRRATASNAVSTSSSTSAGLPRAMTEGRAIVIGFGAVTARR